MTVLIIEDEPLAIERIRHLLQNQQGKVEIVGVTGSIESSVHWLQNNLHPQLILMDIELSDGQSFAIFNQVDVKSPVIFTTSYDEYAIKAFKANTVDYLLKPIRESDLQMALQKLQGLKQQFSTAPAGLENLLRDLQYKGKEYRDRFLVKTGQRYFSIETENIAYFYYANRVTYLKTWKNEQYYLDYILDELEEMLSPNVFFRANRQYILNIKSVKDIHSYFNHKLKLVLRPPAKDEVLVSKEKANEFKNWMGR